jgi:hypothetical protein
LHFNSEQNIYDIKKIREREREKERKRETGKERKNHEEIVFCLLL